MRWPSHLAMAGVASVAMTLVALVTVLGGAGTRPPDPQGLLPGWSPPPGCASPD